MRRIPAHMESGDATRALIFEAAAEVVAVSALDHDPQQREVHLIVVAVSEGATGARLDDPERTPLVGVVMQETLFRAVEYDEPLVTALVGRGNTRSENMLTRSGFSLGGRFDADYNIWTMALPGPAG